MLRESLTRHHPVAVATDLRDTLHNADVPLRPTMRELATVGTTADILACREDKEPYWYHGPRFIVKFVGQQQFRILCLRRPMGKKHQLIIAMVYTLYRQIIGTSTIIV